MIRMTRRGFLGGLVGLACGLIVAPAAALTSTTPTVRKLHEAHAATDDLPYTFKDGILTIKPHRVCQNMTFHGVRMIVMGEQALLTGCYIILAAHMPRILISSGIRRNSFEAATVLTG